jgi:hypothetical protein
MLKIALILFLSALLGFAQLQPAAIPTELFAAPGELERLVPGQPVPELELMDALGKATALPQQGRYALWILTTPSAFEEAGGSIPLEYREPQGMSLSANPASLPPRLALSQPSYIALYKSPLERSELVLGPADRERLQDYFEPYTVLFDDQERLGELSVAQTERGLRSLPLEGLYLIEDGTVRYRYLFPWIWGDFAWEDVRREGVMGVVEEGARAFLQGQEPEVFPLPLAVSGTAVPRDFGLEERPLFLLRVSGFEAEAPQDGVRAEITVNPDGSTEGNVDISHPASHNRLLLERLTPVLEEAGVQAVGLVTLNPEAIPRLEAAFPDWRFVSVADVDMRLRWWEVLSAVLTDAQGRVYMPLYVGMSLEPESASLERALQEVR